MRLLHQAGDVADGQEVLLRAVDRRRRRGHRHLIDLPHPGRPAAGALVESEHGFAAAVLLRRRRERRAEDRRAGGAGLAVRSPTAVDLDLAHVHPLVAGVDAAAAQRDGAAGDAVELAAAEDPRRLVFVALPRPGVGHQSMVGADVAGGGHGERRHVRRLGGVGVVDAGLVLRQPRRVALVVAGDDGVLGAERRRVDAVPVDQADRRAVAQHVQGGGFAVDAVGEHGLVGVGVAVERAPGAVDAGVGDGAPGQGDLRRRQVGVGPFDGQHDAGDGGLEGHGPETQRGQVDHQVPRGAARRDVGVRGPDEHVALVVRVAEARLQAADDLQLDGLEHQSHVGGDVGDAAAVAVVEDEGAGELPLPQPRGLLFQHRVAVHAGAERFAGHVGHAAAHGHGHG